MRSTNRIQILLTLHQTCLGLNEILVGEKYQSSTKLATDVHVFYYKLSAQTAHATVPFCPNVNLVANWQKRTLRVNIMTHTQKKPSSLIRNNHRPTLLKTTGCYRTMSAIRQTSLQTLTNIIIYHYHLTWPAIPSLSTPVLPLVFSVTTSHVWVPRGLVLSPIIFLLYAADLQQLIQRHSWSPMRLPMTTQLGNQNLICHDASYQ